MTFVPYRSAGLLIPYNNVLHLFAVLNDPDQDKMCLTVMVTSIKKDKPYDPACVLNVGDHEFIRHPSYMLYRMANTVFAPHVSNMVAQNYYIVRADIQQSVLERISAGLYASDNTTGVVMKYAKSVGI